MTTDDIIRMAREAGFADGVAEIVGLEGFANYFADNKKALEAALEQPEQPADRRALQAAGIHPAPCARHCEAKAFEIEIRSLKSALRTALAQPEQEQMRMPKVGDRVICLEDESFGTVASLTAGGSPDIAFDDGSRGTYMVNEFAKLFGYVTPPAAQRPWQGLTEEEFLEACELAERGNYLLAFQRIQAKLKERNG
jgi:hypothetical protein